MSPTQDQSVRLRQLPTIGQMRLGRDRRGLLLGLWKEVKKGWYFGLRQAYNIL